jgi:hypothetical protein
LPQFRRIASDGRLTDMALEAYGALEAWCPPSAELSGFRGGVGAASGQRPNGKCRFS